MTFFGSCLAYLVLAVACLGIYCSVASFLHPETIHGVDGNRHD
ncbi:hypothetical protein [Pseudomonas phage vB_PseuGesM_254]|uniref:Uncharacterized protein n=1 Tax=Pseudomonas phage vB_PseuGesM_254 TaxID=3092638 RepID=A0AAX4G6P4_9CAUD|nr:hypothetical protein [Pseudomonas phage PseuGes_254]